jgi:hypothetical protein
MLAFTGQVAAEGWTKTFGLVENRNRAADGAAFRAAKLATPTSRGATADDNANSCPAARHPAGCPAEQAARAKGCSEGLMPLRDAGEGRRASRGASRAVCHPRCVTPRRHRAQPKGSEAWQSSESLFLFDLGAIKTRGDMSSSQVCTATALQPTAPRWPGLRRAERWENSIPRRFDS